MQRIPEPEYMDLANEAQAYAEADFDEVNQAFAERLLAFDTLGDDRTALDLGIGPGAIPAYLLARRSGWRIVGLDASQAMLMIARTHMRDRRLSGRLSLVQADAKWLPFPDSVFDLLLSNSILHHVSDTLCLWRELARVAKPGASVFVRDLHRPGSVAETRRIVQQYASEESALLQEEFYRSLLAAYTVAEVQQQIEQAGITGMIVQKVTDRHLDVYGRIRHCPCL